jgi:hypothetical protein
MERVQLAHRHGSEALVEMAKFDSPFFGRFGVSLGIIRFIFDMDAT